MNGGSPSETVTFTPTDSTDYATATGTVTVNVDPATPNLSLSATGITYGTVLDNSQLSASTASWTVGTATETVSGTFAFASLVAPDGGSPSETVTFTPGDSTDYTSATGTVTVNVAGPRPRCR